MRESGIETEQAFKKKGAMRARSPRGALPEIRIRPRLGLAGHAVGAHVPLGGEGNIDLHVGACDIGVLSPDDGTPLLSRQQTGDRGARQAPRKIKTKRQLDPAEARATVLAMDCPHVLFGNPQLRERLAPGMAKGPQLAGVFLALLDGDGYRTHFAKNPAAATPVQEETVEMIAGALGTRL